MIHKRHAEGTNGAPGMDPSLRWGDGGVGARGGCAEPKLAAAVAVAVFDDPHCLTPSFQRRLESIVMIHKGHAEGTNGAPGMDPRLLPLLTREKKE